MTLILGSERNFLGDLLGPGRPPLAESYKNFDQAVKLIGPLVARFPHIPYHRAELAFALNGRGSCRLVSRANLDGTKRVPRFTQDLLARHTEGYPTAQQILERVKSGNLNRGLAAIGEGHDTEGSRWITAQSSVTPPMVRIALNLPSGRAPSRGWRRGRADSPKAPRNQTGHPPECRCATR